MSNLKINIRILFWHFQVDNQWKVKITKNVYYWQRYSLKGILKIPFRICEWDLRK